MQQPQVQFIDLYRSGLRTMNDIMKSSLETAERLENQQLQQIHKALEETERSTAQLGQVDNFGELLAAEAKLAGAQVARTMDFWSTVWRSAGDAQISLISQMQSLTSRATEDAVRFATGQAATASATAKEAVKEASDTLAKAAERPQQRKPG
jgi:hypothetical protein